MTSTLPPPPKVLPAQLAFLAIYNPFLGPTDETFPNQLVYYYSRAAEEARSASKKKGKDGAQGGGGKDKDKDRERVEEENERLRQIGLAQGMVGFAQSFSSGEAVDSIETERSRIVLKELEKGWWILASVELTRLPSTTVSTSAKKPGEAREENQTVEYSSREVSPPALLVQQLVQAHLLFCLHHGPSLDDLYVRLPRDKFCSTLDRFWTRFARGWDVLLHGNPAVDIFGGLKLASGGELGYGVGEEDWGSGEREVLEDLIRRTAGLQDLMVSRFGDPAAEKEKDDKQLQDEEALPWMGSASEPAATDGLVFSGVGALERHSIRDVSLWMRQIYSYGEYAYGVRDNPSRERRKRRRRNPEFTRAANGNVPRPKSKSPEPGGSERQRNNIEGKKNAEFNKNSELSDQDVAQEDHAVKVLKDRRPEIYPRIVSHDHATTPEETLPPPSDGSRPNIPPPIVIATERALEQATSRVDQAASESEAGDNDTTEEGSTTLGIPDQYMKYLTFGLSTLAKPAAKRPTAFRQSSTSITPKPDGKQKKVEKAKANATAEQETDPPMSQIDPIPDGETLRSRVSMQIRWENQGHFLIGLRGDLDTPTDDEDIEFTDGSLTMEAGGSRIVLRTIQVQVTDRYVDDDEDGGPTSHDMKASSLPSRGYRRLRVLIYVHRPFIYCFLFKNRTSSLQYTEFYRSLHQILSPIRKALLSSTDVKKIAQRIEESHVNATADSDTGSDPTRNTLPSRGTSTAPIFDLLWDPHLLTVHTSVPNIPMPGTLAAEGIFMGGETTLPPGWTRVEALNVHSQILNTLQSVKFRTHDIERTSKTSRGWWVVWMKLPPSQLSSANDDEPNTTSTADSEATLRSDEPVQNSGGVMTFTTLPETQEDMHRIAFLVRKATETSATSKTTSAGSRAMTSLLGSMSLGLGNRSQDPTGGADAGWGPAALAGGIGFDARKYVEGLLSLNR